MTSGGLRSLHATEPPHPLGPTWHQRLQNDCPTAGPTQPSPAAQSDKYVHPASTPPPPTRKQSVPVVTGLGKHPTGPPPHEAGSASSQAVSQTARFGIPASFALRGTMQ